MVLGGNTKIFRKNCFGDDLLQRSQVTEVKHFRIPLRERLRMLALWS